MAAARGRWAAAAQLLAGATALGAAIGTHLEPDELTGHEHLVRIVATALGEDHFTALWMEGCARPLGEMLATLAAETGTDAAPETGERTLSRAEACPTRTR